MNKEEVLKKWLNEYRQEKSIPLIRYVSKDNLLEWLAEAEAKKFRLPVVSGTSVSDVAVCVCSWTPSLAEKIKGKCFICDKKLR